MTTINKKKLMTIATININQLSSIQSLDDYNKLSIVLVIINKIYWYKCSNQLCILKQKKPPKWTSIFLPDAISQPWTMVIISSNAPITILAMFRSYRHRYLKVRFRVGVGLRVGWGSEMYTITCIAISFFYIVRFLDLIHFLSIFNDIFVNYLYLNRLIVFILRFCSSSYTYLVIL